MYPDTRLFIDGRWRASSSGRTRDGTEAMVACVSTKFVSHATQV